MSVAIIGYKIIRYRKFPSFILPIYNQKLLVGVRLVLTFSCRSCGNKADAADLAEKSE